MSIITDLKEQFKSSYVEIIHFKSNQQDSSEFLEHDMPYPLTISHYDGGYKISWALDGYSGTRTGKEYKFDTIDKIARALNAEVLPYLPNTNELYHPHISHYNEFQGIDLPREKKKPKRDVMTQSGEDDLLFDYCRYDVYELKERGLLYYERVYDILDEANQRLSFNKSHSDIKSKARNMFEWTEENYTPGIGKSKKQQNAEYYQRNKKTKQIKNQKEEIVMTRKEASKKANDIKTARVKIKIENAISRLLLTGEKLNQNKVSLIAGVNRRTVAKYWTEFI